MKTVNQQVLARYLKRKISEHKPINHLSQNEFVSQRITAAKRAFLQPQLRMARLTRPKENNQPTTSCSKTPRNHYWKTYATTSWFQTSLSHNSSQFSTEHVLKRSSVLRGYPCQLRQANQQFLAQERERIKPLSEHKRINQLLRNEFVSQLISAVNRACIQVNLSVAKVTWPTENTQPTKFPREDSKEPLPKNMHIHLHRKTYSKTSNSKGKLSRNRSQLSKKHRSRRSSVLRE